MCAYPRGHKHPLLKHITIIKLLVPQKDMSTNQHHTMGSSACGNIKRATLELALHQTQQQNELESIGGKQIYENTSYRFMSRPAVHLNGAYSICLPRCLHFAVDGIKTTTVA